MEATTQSPLEGLDSTSAGARMIIKRAMARSNFPIRAETAPEDLREWALAHPREIGGQVARCFCRAADAWVDGNNSGNSAAHVRGEATCDRKRSQAEAVLSLWGVTCDYPGLYPVLKAQDGRECYSSATELAVGSFLADC